MVAGSLDQQEGKKRALQLKNFIYIYSHAESIKVIRTLYGGRLLIHMRF